MWNLQVNNRGKVNPPSRFLNPSLYISLALHFFYFQTSKYFVAQGIHKYQDSLCYKLIDLCTCIVNININKNVS